MASYAAPLDDIRFVLFDLLESETLLQRLGREEVTRELLDAVLEEGARFTGSVLAPLNGIGDEHYPGDTISLTVEVELAGEACLRVGLVLGGGGAIVFRRHRGRRDH